MTTFMDTLFIRSYCLINIDFKKKGLNDFMY